MTNSKKIKKLKNKPNFRIAFDGVQYSKEEQLYMWSRLVNVLEKLDNERKNKDCMPVKQLGVNMSESFKFKMPKLATIEETVTFLEESAKEANVKNCLTAYRIRQLALTNQIVHIRAGKKILINLDKLVEFLNVGSTSVPEEETAQFDKKYKTISRIEV